MRESCNSHQKFFDILREIFRLPLKLFVTVRQNFNSSSNKNFGTLENLKWWNFTKLVLVVLVIYSVFTMAKRSLWRSWDKIIIHLSQVKKVWDKFIFHRWNFSTLRPNCNSPPNIFFCSLENLKFWSGEFLQSWS